jgi:hypothetical protein
MWLAACGVVSLVSVLDKDLLCSCGLLLYNICLGCFYNLLGCRIFLLHCWFYILRGEDYMKSLAGKAKYGSSS